MKHQEKIEIMSTFLESRQFGKCKESSVKDVVWAMAGLIYIQGQKYLSKAQNCFKRLMKRSSNMKLSNDTSSYIKIMLFEAYLDKEPSEYQVEEMNKLLDNCFSSRNCDTYGYCLYIKAKALMKQKEFNLAFDQLESASKIYQKCPGLESNLKSVPLEELRRHANLDQYRVMTSLADCHQAKGKYKIASELYKKISENCQRNIGIFEDLCYMNMFGSFLQMIQCQIKDNQILDESILALLGHFKKWLDKELSELPHLVKQQWYLQIQNLAQSLYPKECPKKNPTSYLALSNGRDLRKFNKIQDLIGQKKYQEALGLLDKLLAHLDQQTNGNIPAMDLHGLYYDKAKCYFYLQRPEDGVVCLDELLKNEFITLNIKTKDMQGIWAMAEEMYIHMGFYSDAKYHLKMFVSLDPGWTAMKPILNVFYDLSRIHFGLKDYSKTLEYIHQCKMSLKVNEVMSSQRSNWIQMMQAVSHFNLGDYDKAQKVAVRYLIENKYDKNKVLNYQSYDDTYLSRMVELFAHCLRRNGRYKIADEKYTEASKLKYESKQGISTPLNIMAAFSHLLCYYQSQNGTKMASVMRACLSLFTDEPTAVNRTFRELEDRDVTQFALHAFQASVSVCGNPKNRKSKLQTLTFINSTFIIDMFRNIRYQKKKKKPKCAVFSANKFWSLLQ